MRHIFSTRKDMKSLYWDYPLLENVSNIIAVLRFDKTYIFKCDDKKLDTILKEQPRTRQFLITRPDNRTGMAIEKGEINAFIVTPDWDDVTCRIILRQFIDWFNGGKGDIRYTEDNPGNVIEIKDKESYFKHFFTLCQMGYPGFGIAVLYKSDDKKENVPTISPMLIEYRSKTNRFIAHEPGQRKIDAFCKKLDELVQKQYL